MHDWAQTAEQDFGQAFQAINQDIASGGSVMKDLVSLSKQVVQQIIFEFEKLAAINPLLNWVFDGNRPGLDSAGGALGMLFGGGGTTPLNVTGAALASSGAIPGGGTYALQDVAGGGGAGGIGSLFSPSSMFSAGQNFFGGFSSLWNGSGQVTSSLLGTSNFGPGMATSYTPSMFGNVLGIGGGLLAGYSEYKNAGGGVGGALGGAAYGLGTLGAAGAIGGILSGAGAGAGMAGAMGAVGLGSIPVVGWIALGAMVLDKLSGGNLFGTAWKPDGQSSSTINVANGTATTTNAYEEKKKSAFFGGNKYKWVDVAATADQASSDSQLSAGLKQQAEAASSALGSTVAEMISGSFKQVTDKSGKITSEISTVLGKTYSEPAAKFIERMQAETVIANVDAKLGSDEASKIADKYRSNADKLSQASQLLLQAEVDVTKGNSLLGQDKSLTNIAATVQQLAQSNETLIQTYQRLRVETDTVQNAFDLMQVNIGKTGAAFVKFADDAATAAGGASNLQTLFGDYEKNFYSPTEQAQLQAQYTKKKSDEALQALGETAGESMADFRSHFEAAMQSGISADQMVAWLKAGQLLAAAAQAQDAYNKALAQGQAAQQQAQAAQQQAQAARDAALLNYANLVAKIQTGLDNLNHPQSAFDASLLSISTALAQTTVQLNAAAQAAGMAAAREQDLALAREYAAAQAAVAEKTLQTNASDLVTKLLGTSGAAANAGASLQSFANGVTAVGNAVNSFRDSMLIDPSLSPLNAQQQYDEAIKQLRQTGDQQTGRRALEIARGLFASGNDYTQAFDLITGLVHPSATSTGGGGGGGGSSTSSSTTLTASEHLQYAKELAQDIADETGWKNANGETTTFAAVAQKWGYSLDQLSSDLGLQGGDINKYLSSLKAKSYSIDDLASMEYKTITKPIVDAILADRAARQGVHFEPPGGALGKVVTIEALGSPPPASSGPPSEPIARIPGRGGISAPPAPAPAPAPPVDGTLPIIGPPIHTRIASEGAPASAPATEKTAQDLLAQIAKLTQEVINLQRTTSSGAVDTANATRETITPLRDIANNTRNAFTPGGPSVRTPIRVGA